ncbi:MAG: VOC family protein [Dysgonamonadaceae bacterium]|nr:VOC family protein [Dysgonamonadaceae bacterium]
MQYKGTLITISDMEESKKFYQDLLGMHVIGDFGANVQLDNGLFLQTKDTWESIIANKEIKLDNNAGELYFETQDMDAFLKLLEMFQVEYVHEPKEHSWGQRAVRFYDPDHHIIEVAEDLVMVMMRFADSGMSAEEVAVRMDAPLSYIKEQVYQRLCGPDK